MLSSALTTRLSTTDLISWPFTHATIKNLSKNGPEVAVKFNPTEYSISRNMSYAEVQVPGLETPLLQFVRGEAQTLSQLKHPHIIDIVGFGQLDEKRQYMVMEFLEGQTLADEL